ncbi:hypothetical protein [Flavobacterium sp. JP2137]|uniref:helix-turn-helix transcriptional regulator n=1 Tax=Flavobacterium sp. JP2137 TaxID=3414510 RepID=UPI003D2FCE6E
MLIRFAPFLIALLAMCWSTPAKATTTTARLNQLIRTYRDCQLDCLSPNLEAFIRQYPEENPTVIEVVYRVLEADKIVKTQDSKKGATEILYQTAVQLATTTNRADLLIWTQTKAAVYYYRFSELVQAMPYFIKASQNLDRQVPEELIEAQDILKWNAYFFGFIQDYTREQLYLQQAIYLENPASENYSELLNNLGISLFNQNQIDQAEKYFLQSKALALKQHHRVRYAKALGELAKVEIHRHRYDQAEALLLEDIAISKQQHADRNTMYAQILLARLYLKQNALDAAKNTIEEAKKYVKSKEHLASFEYEITEVLLEIAIQNKDFKAELTHRRSIDSLNQIIATTDGSTVVNQLQWQAQKKHIQLELEAEQNKLEKASVIQATAIIVSLLLVLILILIFAIYRRKLKLQNIKFEKNILKFQLEKITSEKKLHDTQSTLASYKVYLSEKNQQLKRLEQEVKKRHHSPHVKKNENALQELLDSHLMTKENWLRFKAVFITEQPEYYQYLTTNFPGLTEANFRIVLLQKLGFKNPEIAKILGITVEAVKKSKQRLKKRFESNYNAILNETV